MTFEPWIYYATVGLGAVTLALVCVACWQNWRR